MKLSIPFSETDRFLSNFKNAEILNDSIEDLKEITIDAVQLFYRSLEYFSYKNDKKAMNSLKACLEELSSLLENVRAHLKTISEFEGQVNDFEDSECFDFLQLWIKVFILQIKGNQITWERKHFNLYTKEMHGFCNAIDQIRFHSSSHRIDQYGSQTKL
ncbi:unnamed protein product [Caenorhabditis brenneri]